MANNILGYQPGNSFVHRLTGGTKLLGFLVLTITGMLSFDLRYLLLLTVFSLVLLWQTHIAWAKMALLVKTVSVFALMNLILIYLFAPQYGTQLFAGKHILLGSGGYALTSEQLLYEGIVLLKYAVSLPLALLFLLTTNPSEFAAGMNKIGISYRVAYAFALTLRYIPDIQAEYQMIANAQQARGFEMSRKAPLKQRIQGAVRIVIPLMLSSLDRIDEISRAMDLRRFGLKKRRTWYYEQVFKKIDWLAFIVVIGLVLLSVGLIVTNGGRYWSPWH
ncbi:MAG: energy-coupling factor transporter transmembrane protein EcfT [Lactobacillaceae bacterium]|nr:energy-coupling factor transporter transmembrane protein EcfT [Lactobacillaceae bacterium]